MFDVITFGSATSDTFLRLKKADAQGVSTEHNLCVCAPFGAKILVDDLQVWSGGGGANAACSFARLGLKTAYVGKIGNDQSGQVVLNDLKKCRVKTSFVKKDKTRNTAASIILSPENGERTILAHHGACHFLAEQEVSWRKIKHTKWFYLAPLYQETGKLLKPLVKFAKENRIKITFNPSLFHLKKGFDFLRQALSQAQAVLLNKEEADLLGGPEKILKVCSGILVITDGAKELKVYRGKEVFKAMPGPAKRIESTGAGDAFGSGFITGLLLKDSIEYAMQLGLANSISCIGQVGAKNGLLEKKDLANLPKIKITKARQNI